MACRDTCGVCGAPVSPAIDLPSLPITDSFCRDPVENGIMGIDQVFQYCRLCGHGQLQNLIDPNVLYGRLYHFRTSESATARKGVDFFLEVLGEASSGRRFRCILDIGCNDLYLLGRLRGVSDCRVGVDPILAGHEGDREDEDIMVLGKSFEDVRADELPERPDLVLCRHTLEHILDPLRFLDHLQEISAADALFVFELPGLDALVERFRFDQVFHQHANYFSLSSIRRFIQSAGCRPLLHRVNYHDWGAMAIAFVRGKGEASLPLERPRWSPEEIGARYDWFQRQMDLCGSALSQVQTKHKYGYGAAQMLPVLGYHLQTDFADFSAILDDDPAKDGLGYWNLPVRIRLSSRVEQFEEAAVLVTAFDNVKPILTRLFERRPRHILLPFCVV